MAEDKNLLNIGATGGTLYNEEITLTCKNIIEKSFYLCEKFLTATQVLKLNSLVKDLDISSFLILFSVFLNNIFLKMCYWLKCVIYEWSFE